MRVLVVDDDEHILLFLATTLKTIGYEVEQAPNALEAFALLDAMKFDLLITDLLMPGIDGSGLITLVRQQQLRLPIIVVSAQLPETPSSDPLPKGVTILRKPLAYQQLIDAVKQAVSEPF